jgi:hypothetical protein
MFVMFFSFWQQGKLQALFLFCLVAVSNLVMLLCKNENVLAMWAGLRSA